MTESSRHPRLLRLAAVVVAAVAIAAGCAGEADRIVLGSDGSIERPGGTDGETIDATINDREVDFRYETFDGDEQAFSTLTDKPVVINFFASWCPTCIAEMPDFEAVHQQLGGEVEFLGLAMQDRRQNAVELVAETGVTYPTGMDLDGDIFRLFEGIGMPTTVFVDADGIVKRVHSGVLSDSSLTDMINDELLS